ncbi:MAG: hypothetical protein IPN70_02065 [Candidatus Moraniibacteriota bacterium]|nr:MAG: hypothetical protein IPN70_02065 [Candidatus Moranbacteria bacterium]
MLKEKIKYSDLNARQKEIYNFQKASAIFAEYGYTTVKLSDDWMGADFIAISFDGEKYLKVQLKGRLTFEKKYLGKKIFICFHDKKNDGWYLYNHDKILKKFIRSIKNSKSWKMKNGYSYRYLQSEHIKILSPFVIG